MLAVLPLISTDFHSICLLVGVTSWLYFTYRTEDVDFKPAPTDPIELEAYEIDIFREYLRIPTVHPDVDYSKTSRLQKLTLLPFRFLCFFKS